MTHDELRQLAIRIHRGEIFTSAQIPAQDTHLMSLIFMPLTFMTEEQRQVLREADPAVFYGHLNDSVRSINGYPMLHDMGYLLREDWSSVVGMIDKLKEAEAAI